MPTTTVPLAVALSMALAVGGTPAVAAANEHAPPYIAQEDAIVAPDEHLPGEDDESSSDAAPAYVLAPYDLGDELPGDGEADESDDDAQPAGPFAYGAVADTHLARAIWSHLGRTGAPGQISADDIASLTGELDASNGAIQDLQGLQYATRLTGVDLSSNRLADLGRLSDLTGLTHVNLSNNELADLTPLSGGSLMWLDASGNSITNPGVLTGVPNLETLDLSGNDIHDTTTLAHLGSLRTLDLSRNGGLENLYGLTPLTGLIELRADDNLIADLAPLAALTSLETLSLAGNVTDDISPLTALANLETLDVSGNRIFTLWALRDIEGLSITATGQELPSQTVAAAAPFAGLHRVFGAQHHDVALTFSGPRAPIHTDAGTIFPIADTWTARWSTDGGTFTGTFAITAEGDTGPHRYGVVADHRIAEAVWEKLGTPAEERTFISAADMARLPALTVGGSGIQDLSGLQYATNLASLDLSGHRIQDLGPIMALTSLVELDLAGNSVDNLAQLAALVNLTHLDLSGNPLGGLNGLQHLTQLTHLDLSNVSDAAGAIEDLSYLANLTALVELRIAGHDLEDIAPLAGLVNLTTLDLAGNILQDVGALASLTGLTSLDLSGNAVANIEPLAGMVLLTSLDLSDNLVDNTLPLGGMTHLTSLDLSNNRVDSIEALANLEALTSLDLSNNRVDNIGPLADLDLAELHLTGNVVTDFSHLQGMDTITTLSLADKGFEAISLALGHVSGMPNLALLDLSGNQIAHGEIVSGISSDVELNLDRNHIVDLSSFGNRPIVSALDQSPAPAAGTVGQQVPGIVRNAEGHVIELTFEAPEVLAADGTFALPGTHVAHWGDQRLMSATGFSGTIVFEVEAADEPGDPVDPPVAPPAPPVAPPVQPSTPDAGAPSTDMPLVDAPAVADASAAEEEQVADDAEDAVEVEDAGDDEIVAAAPASRSFPIGIVASAVAAALAAAGAGVYALIRRRRLG